MLKPDIRDILTMPGDGTEIIVEGWIRTKRESKGVTFLEVNDGSSIRNLQIVIEENLSDYGSMVRDLNTGASITVEGILTDSPGTGQVVELKARKIDMRGAAPADYALQKKRHTLEFLREIAHLRPRTNSFGAVARVRSALSFAIHRYFQERGFIYVHTPIITGSDCEGAGEMFQVTTLPLDQVPLQNGRVDFSQDFFGKRALLTVSGQLEGEAYACALKKIYTFGPTFRAENSNTSRHLAEFWMIEPEMAFCDIHGNMDVAEEFLRYIFRYILENCPNDMDFFNEKISPGLIENLNAIIQSSFQRISYTEAVEQLLKSKASFEFPLSWGVDLQSEHEKFLTEKIYARPVIITDYPKEIKAFYMKMNEDDKTVRAMDILVPRLGEIVGGSERESDYEKLKQRISGYGLNPDDYWWYLELRRFGTVPHSGFGLGFERTMQCVPRMQNIRDVIPLPRTVKSLEF